MTIAENNVQTWSVTMEPEEAGGPYNVKVSYKDITIKLEDVMFGDVWLCSGQSNMEFTVLQVIF